MPFIKPSSKTSTPAADGAECSGSGLYQELRPAGQNASQVQRVERIRDTLARHRHDVALVEDDFPVVGEESEDVSGLGNFGHSRTNIDY